MGVLSVRLDKDTEESLEFLMEKRKIVDKSAYIRKLLDESLQKDLLDFLCFEVQKKRMSAWKGAEIANISLRAFLQEYYERGYESYDEQSLREDLEYIMGD